MSRSCSSLAPLAVLCIFAWCSIALGDDHQQQLATPRGPTTSPFAPPTADDRTFVVNTGPGLDTGCTFRSGGPLVITIPVTRYLGPTDSQGRLQNVDQLVRDGLLKRFVTITFPAFDVDFDATPDKECPAPERDRIRFNGELIEPYWENSQYVQGQHNTWRLNSVSVPIQKVRFPSSPGSVSAGTPPTHAINTLTIEVDTGNTENECWCTAID